MNTDFRGVKIGCYQSSSNHRPYEGAMSKGHQWTEHYLMADYPCTPPEKGETTQTRTCPICKAEISIKVSSLAQAWKLRMIILALWFGLALFTYAVGPAVMILHILGSIFLLGGASDLGSLIYTVNVTGGPKHTIQQDLSERARTRLVLWRIGLFLLFVASVAAFILIEKASGIKGKWY